jgi:hypothetical protein
MSTESDHSECLSTSRNGEFVAQVHVYKMKEMVE